MVRHYSDEGVVGCVSFPLISEACTQDLLAPSRIFITEDE